HFKPGRIDLDNVMIDPARPEMAAPPGSDRGRHAATLAGPLTALAAGVSLRGLPFLAVGGAPPALRVVGIGDHPASQTQAAAPALARYGVALVCSMLIGFLVSVAPPHWSRAACDAIAINWLLAGGGGGLGLAAMAWVLPHARLPARIA